MIWTVAPNESKSLGTTAGHTLPKGTTMPENTTPPPLDGEDLRYAMADVMTTHINGAHPDLPALSWMPASDGGVLGDYLGGYTKTPEERATIAAAWAQRLGLEQIDARYAGQVRYRGKVGTISRVDLIVTVDHAALKADIDARMAAYAAEAGEQ